MVYWWLYDFVELLLFQYAFENSHEIPEYSTKDEAAFWILGSMDLSLMKASI
jgi:hypothetical protein